MKTRLEFNKWNHRPHKTVWPQWDNCAVFDPLLHKKGEATAIKNMTS